MSIKSLMIILKNFKSKENLPTSRLLSLYIKGLIIYIEHLKNLNYKMNQDTPKN